MRRTLPDEDLAAVTEPELPPEDPKDASDRSITRRDFEAVIRRAAELSSAESDGEDESLSEDEVIRIAKDLGLPDRYVQQALFELPQIPHERGRADYFGDAVLTATRIVPGNAPQLLRRIEDYLSTREYLQVVRRRTDRSFLMPAEDAISNLVRGLARPSSRHYLSRAKRVVVSVRPVETGKAHVQIALDLSEHRKNSLRGGWIGGTIGGLAVGTFAVIMIGIADLPSGVTIASQIAAFAAGFGGVVTGTLAATRAAFRRAVGVAKFELDGLLDRAEHGQTLEPPPAPWRKRLQQKFLGN
jgi:hypothetical protein